MRRQCACIAVFLFALSTTCLGEGGYTLQVPTEYPTVQAAWDAIPGDGTGGTSTYVIQVASGTYLGSTYLSGKTARIEGPSCRKCKPAIFDGGNVDPVFVLLDNSNVEMSDCVIQNGLGLGTPSLGGGFYVGGTLELTRCTIQNCNATSGGAIFVTADGSCTIKGNSQILNNLAEIDGGGIYGSPGASLHLPSWAPITEFECHFEGNVATRGGAIGFRGAITIEGTAIFEANAATASGAHVWISSSEDSSFSDCAFRTGGVYGDADAGGALAIVDTPATINLQYSIFLENGVTGPGGGILVSNSQGDSSQTVLNCSNVNFLDCVAVSGHGGGIAFFNTGNITLDSCQVHSNESSAGGGGLYVELGTCVIAGTEFANNTSIDIAGEGSTGGAMLFVNGDLSYTGGAVAQNVVNNSGGGIALIHSTATIDGVEFFRNGNAGEEGSPDSIGGGIYSEWSAPPPPGIVDLEINECRFQNCASNRSLWLVNTGTEIYDCTFAHNSAGVIRLENSDLTVTESFFWSNHSILSDGTAISAHSSSNVTALDNLFLTGDCLLCSGAAIHVGPMAALDAEGNNFERGFAVENGGAIYIQGDGPQITLRENIFNGNNCSGQGGAIMNERAFTVFESCSFWQNDAADIGGAIRTTDEIILYLTDFCGNTPEDISGEWSDLGGSTFDEFCPCQGFSGDCLCLGDINFDGSVDGADLALLLGAWGKCADCIGLEDLTLDGIVDGADLALLLGAWGDCRTP